MADAIQSYKVISGGGLNSNENHLDLAENIPGSATRLVNYEVSLYGGYRRINGFVPYDEQFPEVGVGEAEGEVLCVAFFKDNVYGRTYPIAARRDIGGATYSFYRHLPLVGWEKMDIGTTQNTSRLTDTLHKVRHISFNFGDGNKIVFVDGINPPLIFEGDHFDHLLVEGDGSHDVQGSHSPGGDQLLQYPSIVDVFENHLWFGKDASKEAVICHSAPNNPYDFTVASGAGQLTIGFDVVQFKPFRDSLFIFGSNSIKKAYADITAGFLLDQVTTNVGCVATDSVLEIGGDLAFLAPDGIRPVAGTSRIGDVELETISKSIQSILIDLPKDYDVDRLLTGVVVRTKSQLRYFIGDDKYQPRDSVGIIGGLRTSDQRLGWEFGELLGIRASCATSGFVDGTEYVLHGDYDGCVYHQEQGSTFNGEGIVGIYATPYYDFGDTEVRKVLRKINTFVRAEGPVEMNIAVQYDWDDTATAKPPSYSQDSKGAPVVYGGRNIDYAGTNIRYGGNEKPIMTTSVQGSGYSVKVTYVTLGENSPHSIQGMVFEFSVAGRR